MQILSDSQFQYTPNKNVCDTFFGHTFAHFNHDTVNIKAHFIL